MEILFWIYLVMSAFALGGVAAFALFGYMLTGKVSRGFILHGIGYGLAWPFLYPYMFARELVNEMRRK